MAGFTFKGWVGTMNASFDDAIATHEEVFVRAPQTNDTDLLYAILGRIADVVFTPVHRPTDPVVCRSRAILKKAHQLRSAAILRALCTLYLQISEHVYTSTCT